MWFFVRSFAKEKLNKCHTISVNCITLGKKFHSDCVMNHSENEIITKLLRHKVKLHCWDCSEHAVTQNCTFVHVLNGKFALNVRWIFLVSFHQCFTLLNHILCFVMILSFYNLWYYIEFCKSTSNYERKRWIHRKMNHLHLDGFANRTWWWNDVTEKNARISRIRHIQMISFNMMRWISCQFDFYLSCYGTHKIYNLKKKILYNYGLRTMITVKMLNLRKK